MDTLQTLFPKAEDLLATAPEDLAPLLLRLARAKVQSGGMFWPDSLADEIKFGFLGQSNEYPHNRKHQVEAAISEAWNWLRTNSLIAPAPDMNGRNGWMIITRSGQEIIDDEGFERFRAAKTFPKALLHPINC
jgi:hypothetical protein